MNQHALEANTQAAVKGVISLCSDLHGKAIIQVDPLTIAYTRLDLNLRDQGFFVIRVDSVPIHTQEDLFMSLYNNGDFPGYFGFNWDALDECLNDFHWRPAKGYVLIFARPSNLEEAALDSFLETLQETSIEWQQRNIPFKLIIPKAL